MTMIETDDGLSWLDLAPAGTIPDGYREALRDAHADDARHASVRAEIARLEGVLREACADREVAPQRLVAAASDLAAWREVWAAMPASRAVPAEVDEAIAAALAATGLPDLSPGTPPLAAADALHHVIAHPRELPPMITERDAEAISTFEAVAAEGVRVRAAVDALRGPLNGTPLASRVRAWHELREGALAEHRATITALRMLIEDTDAERVESGRAHRCRQWGGSLVALDPVPAGVAWCLEWALAGNGRPPHAAAPWRPANAS